MTTAEDVEIRFLGDLQRLEIKPGDRFVLTVQGLVTAEVAKRIQEYFKAWSDSPVLVLSEGMKLGVVSGEACLPSEDSPQAETT